MYKMVRCGSGFGLVIMVSPPEAGLDTPNAKYYCWSWQIGAQQPGAFEEISRNTYFSGIADGLGFEELPADIFPTLEAALQYITEKREELGRKQLEERGIYPDKDE